MEPVSVGSLPGSFVLAPARRLSLSARCKLAAEVSSGRRAAAAELRALVQLARPIRAPKRSSLGLEMERKVRAFNWTVSGLLLLAQKSTGRRLLARGQCKLLGESETEARRQWRLGTRN